MKLDPWVLVAGGFHRHGGMDKLNLAFARYLVCTGRPVHLVSYSVADQLSGNPLVTRYLVRKPFGSFLMGGFALNSRGRRIARRVKSRHPGVRVLTNGGSCHWNDMSWAHCVHRAWPCQDETAPLWFRIKNRFAKKLALVTERRAFRAARLVIANSEKTRRDLIESIGVDPLKVHTVYPGAQPDWTPATSLERRAARSQFGQPEARPLAVFIGALSLDDNKGFGILWSAWQRLCNDERWDAHLIIAGSGTGLRRWQARVSASDYADRVTFLGFTNQVADLLAATDVLISPAHYEAYGLNVQEAVCRGVPAIVSESAGVAELFPQVARPLLLPDPATVADLVERLRLWRSDVVLWKSRFHSFGTALQQNTWDEMARRILALAGE